MSTDTDINNATRENKTCEMKYEADYNECIKRKISYNNNKINASALLWERCAKIMQNKISTRVDFETKIYDNPVKLLKAIREHAMDYQETKYEMSIIVEDLKAMMTTKQREGESLAEDTWQFKTAKDVLESYIGGALILTKYVKRMANYIHKDTASFEKLQRRQFKTVCILVFGELSSKVRFYHAKTWYNRSCLAMSNTQKQ